LRIVWIFNNFNLIFLLTGGGPSISTQNLPIMSYKYAWNSYEMGKSSSVSVIMLMILTVLFYLYQYVNNKTQGGEDAF
jgi:multiple sugar transport system permease protein